MMDRKVPLNEEEATVVLSSMKDPVARELVRLVVARVRMQFMPRHGESVEERERRMPAAPFDMHFMVQTLVSVFSQHETIRKVLDGQTLAEATGWDV
jgi:hypothetical protein